MDAGAKMEKELGREGKEAAVSGRRGGRGVVFGNGHADGEYFSFRRAEGVEPEFCLDRIAKDMNSTRKGERLMRQGGPALEPRGRGGPSLASGDRDDAFSEQGGSLQMPLPLQCGQPPPRMGVGRRRVFEQGRYGQIRW